MVAADGRPEDDRPITERVADELRDRIRYGKLAAGQRLIESDLVGEMGVSRNTMRAAFTHLAAEGIVVLERNRGARVRTFDAAEMTELFQLRATLEGRAAGLLADRIDAPGCRAVVDELIASNDAFDPTVSFFVYWEFNERLHKGVLENCGNAMLMRFAEQTRTLTSHYYLRAASRTDPDELVSIRCSCEQHKAVLEAVLRGDAAEAELQMREHIHTTGSNIVTFMSSEKAPALWRP